MLLIILILVAVAVIALVVGVVDRSQGVLTQERLIQVTKGRERIGTAVQQELAVPFHKRLLAPWVS
ncbi:MAG: hypothetical protein AB7W28_06540, partial [Armatimonadota bacterium]